MRNRKADLVAVDELKEQRERDGSIHRLKHRLVEVRRLERDLKELNLGDAVTGREIGRFRGEFVFPKNLADLGHEEFSDPRRGLGVRVDLRLWHHAIYFGLFRVGEHAHQVSGWTTRNAINSKSLRPLIELRSAVVLPPVKRLSMSFSSFIAIIDWIAFCNRAE